jgi:beta-phosphoglucomutase-like phosphatase (HAD superfamily)
MTNEPTDECGRRQHRFRAVPWGIDGTLLLSESINFRALRHALYTEGVVASNEFHQEIVGQSATVVHKKCRQSFGISVSLNEWRRLKYSYCTAHAAEIAARPGALGVGRMFEQLRLR